MGSVSKANPGWPDQPRDSSTGRWTTGGDDGSHTEQLRSAVRAFGSSIHSVWHKLPSEVRHAIAAVAAEHLARHVHQALTSSSPSARIMERARSEMARQATQRAVGKSLFMPSNSARSATPSAGSVSGEPIARQAAISRDRLRHMVPQDLYEHRAAVAEARRRR